MGQGYDDLPFAGNYDEPAQEAILQHKGVVVDTGKAYCFQISETEGVWIPRKLVTLLTESEVHFYDLIKQTKVTLF